jgi:hypothetical protein
MKKQGDQMASEWLTLTGAASKKSIYVNMANASSLIPNGTGSDILFQCDPGKEGKIQVAESPNVILTRLSEIKRSQRT